MRVSQDKTVLERKRNSGKIYSNKQRLSVFGGQPFFYIILKTPSLVPQAKNPAS